MNDLVERWLHFAQQDLQGSEIMLRENLYNLACFHAQQCVEKAIKGLLTAKGQTPPRIHAIAELLTCLPALWEQDLRIQIIRLDDFYIPTRYPDALPGMLPDGLPQQAEAEEALMLARTILEHVRAELESSCQ